jgi:hypothetical protein
LEGQPVRCPSCNNVFTAGSADPQPLEPPKVEQTSVRETVDPPRPRPAVRVDRHGDWDDDDDDYPRRRRVRRDCAPHRASTVLVLGILSLVICHVILGPIAWIMGSADLRAMRDGRMDPEGEGSTRAGMICGIIGTCLALFGCLIWAFLLAGGLGRKF